MNPFDFIAIGDITTDAFIRIKDAQVHCSINRETCELCVRFGDKVPYEFVEVVRAVGNSPNAAVSAARLGLKSALITNLGDDQNGEECFESLKQNGVAVDYVKVHKEGVTNYHYVLWYEEERTILVKHHEYEYALPKVEPAPKWIYLSSLAPNSLPYHQDIAHWLKNNPEVKLAFQPGTFQIKLGPEKLTDIYKCSELFFCNKEEARRVLNQPKEDDIKKLLAGLCDLGPKVAIVTDGPKGAYSYDGGEMWHVPMYPDPKPPVDRTGAGDAFASTFTCALILGKSIQEALAWGPINSMSVVQDVGAQKGLLPRAQLEKYLAKAPPEYKVQKIS